MTPISLSKSLSLRIAHKFSIKRQTTTFKPVQYLFLSKNPVRKKKKRIYWDSEKATSKLNRSIWLFLVSSVWWKVTIQQYINCFSVCFRFAEPHEPFRLLAAHVFPPVSVIRYVPVRSQPEPARVPHSLVSSVFSVWSSSRFQPLALCLRCLSNNPPSARQLTRPARFSLALLIETGPRFLFCKAHVYLIVRSDFPSPLFFINVSGHELLSVSFL